ncbi:Glutathione synthase [Dillenia turbinata]|uniref:Glutathione synthetase n=1 Tax=Dillenia turbinata TaxID=194707 RepID=A0AAN8U784_9MAGN
MSLNYSKVKHMKTYDPLGIDPELVQKLVYDALVWSSLHGLLVGDRNVQRSGKIPGMGMVHAPVALLPMSFPEHYWRQACELAPIFSELIDRVSLDGKFLQDALFRTKKVDDSTSRLLDIHSKMLKINKEEEIRLGLHRSDYMLDEQTKLLLQIELNTISSSFAGLGCLVSELHRAVVMVVIQTEEHNMYDQHWLSSTLKDTYPFQFTHNVTTIRKTLAEIDAEGQLLPDGTLTVGGQTVAVVYFRAGYAPTDYPSESEWRSRLLMEQSSAVVPINCLPFSRHQEDSARAGEAKCASEVIVHLFLENKEDIAKLRKCFAGLWSLDDSNIINDAIERPQLYVMKPQRGGGNDIYGDDVRETLQRLKKEGTEEDAAYIHMQWIFPTVSPTFLMQDGICHQDRSISELGIYSAYLRNRENVIINEHSGYLMRTKVASSNEGGAAGFAVLDSIYLT